ncbi:pyridoxal-dependent decarboxylase [Rhodocytophaga aerolata]|uniref:Pyridoxal-dependent decarboxylase n=1 Tax=Rhodocytophaga aerolata TaxID=455078 RepID=A0ABT8RG27_9BACT|nr:pyridoxal-dependent decarboxylase [Rhodocytophaga aerolata]MDO1450934.1 pyridoxal-dependent decarboxylase [Rhodocytophaga aerolata]
MHPLFQQDLQNIDQLLEQVRQLSSDYLSTIAVKPTGLAQPPTAAFTLPTEGAGAASAITYFNTYIQPYLVASSGPRYLGYVTGGGTLAAIAGDWLTSVFDQNTQNTTGIGDLSAFLEVATIRMLLDLLQLPDDFYGGFVTGATVSNFTCLAVARQWVGQQSGKDIARDGLPFAIDIYSATPHSSTLKSLAMLGIGSGNIISVPTLDSREAMDVGALEQLLQQKANKPFILLCSGGTVNSVDFDDMQAIARLKNNYTFWWHIDAAFGGFAACSPAYAHLLKGWEQADSITIDGHKWLNVPYDSAVFFTRKAHASLQVQTFQNTNAPYLGDPSEKFSYLNFLPENSRRFRALPAWFTLHAYGKKGYQSVVEHSISMAQLLGEKLEKSGLYILSAPVWLNVVCFTTRREENRGASVQRIVEKLNARGKVFLTPTVYKGVPSLRAAFVNWRTTQADIDLTIEELLAVYE